MLSMILTTGFILNISVRFVRYSVGLTNPELSDNAVDCKIIPLFGDEQPNSRLNRNPFNNRMY